jgi:mannose-6-phosphate isomerase-like protein (cupin superfamily)
MTAFASMRLPSKTTVFAPDGSEVRVLLSLASGSMAHFRLAPGKVSRAMEHRTVEEIWYVLSGRGQMWRKAGEREETIELEPGVCLTIPMGTRFQFRASAAEAVSAVGVTIPPWFGEAEAVPAEGPWQASDGR